MAGNPHPVFQDGVPVEKANARAFLPLRLGNPDALRALDGSTFWLVYIQTLVAFFYRDTGDTTSEDNGTSVIEDGNGGIWKVISSGAGIAIGAAGPLADRGDFDSEDPGFTYFGTDTELLYIRLTDGGWSSGSSIVGPPGPTGDDSTVPGPPGTSGTNGASSLTVVRLVATTNVTIASGLENGDTVDGVSLITGDLVLLSGQSSAAENGVYQAVASGAASRLAAFNTYDSMPGCYFSVMEGTAGADKLYRCTSNKGGTLGTTAIAISEFTSGGGASGIATPQGRLTLASGVPVMATTQSAKTTIYYSPYLGNQIPIYNGSSFQNSAFTERSVATTDTTKSPAAIGASKVNDWFIWDDSGTLRLGHGPDWTNDTTRSAGTALVSVNGILLNNATITNGPAAQRGTYVGTTRSNASSQLDWIFGSAASGGGAGFHGVWNMYNRVSIASIVVDNGSSYTYTSASYRQARGSAGNQVSFVMGLAEDAIAACYVARLQTVAALTAYGQMVPGLDTTSSPTTLASAWVNNAATATVTIHSNVVPFPAQLGFHYVAAIESGDGTNANTFGNTGLNTLSVQMRM